MSSITDAYISLTQRSDCLSYIPGWMTNNRATLNVDKTTFIIIGTSRQRIKLTCYFPTPILNQIITESHIVRNLVIIFKSDFNFRKYIAQICRCFFYNIHDIRRIRSYISLSVAKTLLYNSILVGLNTAILLFITSHIWVLQNINVFS